VRTFLKRTLERLLSTRVSERVVRSFSGSRDLILAYHNVVPDGEGGRGDQSLHVERSDFAAHLDTLLELAEVVPLRAMVMEPATPRERPRVAVTFDDAYRGAVTIAVEELAARDLTATIFVAPGLLGDRSFWWDDVAFGAEGLDGLTAIRTAALKDLAGRDAAIREFVESRDGWVGRAPAAYRSATVGELAAAVGSGTVILAPHSWSHPNLAALEPVELGAELRRPLAWLQERFDDDTVLPWIAWPYGLHSDEVCDAAAAEGYSAGLRVDGGTMSRPIRDPFRLPRLTVPAGLSIEGFRARVSGTWISL
jgi:peptidoglycan/xylan/chitin deacetylase (PgdA/CDA1 family)